MKKRFLPGVAASCLLIASCSQDEPVEMAGTDEIRFSVATESQSRAAESFCANWLPGSFNVWAKTNPGNALYISGDVVANLGNGTFGYTGDNVRFWPKDGNLDFFAFSGDEGTFNQNLDAPQFVNYKVKDNPVDQLDLIYTVRSNVSKGSGTVALNFRHALSQVVFRASVSNPNLKVVVSNVKIGGLNNQGTYSLPAAETTKNYLDPSHNDEAEDISQLPTKGVGSWSELSGNAAYNVTAATLGTINDNESPNITVNAGQTKVISASYKEHLSGASFDSVDAINRGNPWGKVLNLIPQHQDAWTPGSQSGAYIALNCKIYSTEGAAEMLLNDNEWIYVPVAVDWKQGVRYVYTVDFGNGHAGWTDGPEGPNPQPTLGNISVNCESVDDFATLGGEPKTYTVRFLNEGVHTPGLEDIVTVTTRNSFTVTIPQTIPEFAYKGMYEQFELKYDQVSMKPQFVMWTRSSIDPHNFVDYNYQNLFGRFGKGSSQTLPLKKDEYTLELVPIWTHYFQYDNNFHFKDNFNLDEPKNTAYKVSFQSVGNPYSEKCSLIENRLSEISSSKNNVPDGYEFIGMSRTYDPITKNIDIQPDYEVVFITVNKSLVPTVYVPIADCSINQDGYFTLELHAVYKKL